MSAAADQDLSGDLLPVMGIAGKLLKNYIGVYRLVTQRLLSDAVRYSHDQHSEGTTVARKRRQVMSKFIKVRTRREGEHPGAEYTQIINLDNVVRLSVPSLHLSDGTEIELTGNGIRDFEKAIDMR